MSGNETEEIDNDSNISGDTDLEFSSASVLEDLQFYVGCLTKLAISLEHPAPDPVETETGPITAMEFDVRGPAEIWCRKIVDRFHDIEIRLAERLGEANWYRFEFFIGMGEASHGALLEETDEPENDEFAMPVPQAKSVISAITKSGTLYSSVFGASSSENRSAEATDLILPAQSVHRFQATDILDSSSQTKWSYLVLNVENFVKLRVLNLPLEALEKSSFCCTICANELYNVKDQLSWR